MLKEQAEWQFGQPQISSNVGLEKMGRRFDSYEEWLSLSDDDRAEAKAGWDAYEREQIGIPYTAAGRFAIASPRAILDVSVGTYHGGEYLIHATVSDEEFSDCPPMLSEEFEGFRVAWLSLTPPDPPPELA